MVGLLNHSFGAMLLRNTVDRVPNTADRVSNTTHGVCNAADRVSDTDMSTLLTVCDRMRRGAWHVVGLLDHSFDAMLLRFTNYQPLWCLFCPHSSTSRYTQC